MRACRLWGTPHCRISGTCCGIEDGRRPLVAAGDLRAIDAMIDLREHNSFLVSAVRHEMLKSARQREPSRFFCAEIEVDGLGSYPHIPGSRPHGADSRCGAAF